MSEYRTISSDYIVSEVDDNCNHIRDLEASDPLFSFAIDEMVKSFNEMKLENSIDNKEAKRKLGYTIKEKIKSIRMKRIHKIDEEGRPYVRITVETYPGTLKMTEKVCGYIGDFISSQYSDGWGEGFFGPGNSFKAPDGTLLAVE